MARLRYNGLSTTLGGSGLTNVATSVTFAAALTHSNGTNVPTIVAPDYIPLAILGATGHLSEIVYLTAYTAAGTTGTITRGQEGTAGAAHSSGDAVTQAPLAADITDAQSLRDVYMRPAASLAETSPRSLSTTSNSPVSGTLFLSPIALSSGMSIGHIAFANSFTAAGTPTHWWFGLYDSSFVQLATTADQTSTAWAANTVKSLAIATTAAGAASSFTTTYTGLYYIGFLMTATTVVDLPQPGNPGTAIPNLTPHGGSSNTGQTTPPAFPFTATAPGSANPFFAYGYVAV